MADRLILVRDNLDDIQRAPSVPDYPIYTALDRDVSGITDLLAAAFPDRDFTDESVRRTILRPFYCFCTFVALFEGKVVATASSRKRFKMGEVAWVACHPDHRNKGISTALVQHVLRDLWGVGMHSACAVLAPPTDVSRAFWDSLGFKQRDGLE